MKLTTLMTAVILMAFSAMASADDKPLQSPVAPGMKNSFETVQAEVIKVFAVDDNGFRFRAYLVQWKDSKVIVSDPLGRSDKKEGEKITFMAQRIELSKGDKPIKTMSFMILDVGAFLENGTGKAPETINAEAELKEAQSEEERFYALGPAAKEAFDKGDYPAAKTYAEELAALTPQYKKDWNYGNAIQDSNVILGRLALRDGNVAAAKTFLLEAGKSKGSPQMNSFGPNVSLAKDLLQKGEKEVVIEYLNACKKFWEMEDGKLDVWIALVKQGRIPDFGPNLDY